MRPDLIRVHIVARLTSLRVLFRQQIFHIGGDAQLSRFSYSFRSFRSGRQLFGIRQRLGRSGIPVVSIDIAVCVCFIRHP
jgi:hypothetical protein